MGKLVHRDGQELQQSGGQLLSHAQKKHEIEQPDANASGLRTSEIGEQNKKS